MRRVPGRLVGRRNLIWVRMRDGSRLISTSPSEESVEKTLLLFTAKRSRDQLVERPIRGIFRENKGTHSDPFSPSRRFES